MAALVWGIFLACLLRRRWSGVFLFGLPIVAALSDDLLALQRHPER
jgi:hypothetical protein